VREIEVGGGSRHAARDQPFVVGWHIDLFRFIPGYEGHIYEAGREPALVMLLSFIVTFACTRGYTRVARARGWGSGNVHGVHLHHVVVGIVLALGAGALQFAFMPEEGVWQLTLAAVFGTGAALVLDEFALVFRLEDVYWSTEGRVSVDAVVLSVGLGLVLLLHTAPVGADSGASDWLLSITVGVNMLFVIVAALKGKLVLASFGVFVWLFAWVGALRLAEPHSVWARRRYREGSHKRQRAERRYRRYAERWRPRKNRVLDLIGGAPSAAEDS
jgi:lysyl-tRNA synthetase class 2